VKLAGHLGASSRLATMGEYDERWIDLLN